MTEKVRLTTIWISPDTYRQLLHIEKILITKNGSGMNPSDAIKELIEFWKRRHQKTWDKRC